jgi:hypothetical protein
MFRAYRNFEGDTGTAELLAPPRLEAPPAEKKP